MTVYFFPLLWRRAWTPLGIMKASPKERAFKSSSDFSWALFLKFMVSSGVGTQPPPMKGNQGQQQQAVCFESLRYSWLWPFFFSKRRAEYWFLVTRYSGTGITWVSAVLKTVKSSTSGHLPAAYLYRRRKQWASSRWHRRTLTWPIGSRAWNREILGEL